MSKSKPYAVYAKPAVPQVPKPDKKALRKARKKAIQAQIAANRQQRATGARLQSLKNVNSEYTAVIKFVESLIPGWQDLSSAAMESTGRYTGALRQNTSKLNAKRDEYQDKIDELERQLLTASGQRYDELYEALQSAQDTLDKIDHALNYFNYGSARNIRNVPGVTAAITKAAAKYGITL